MKTTHVLESHAELEHKLALIDKYCMLHKRTNINVIYNKIMNMSDYELMQLANALAKNLRLYALEGGKK